MSLLVVGSVALDSIFTPFGETADALGGSAVYFSVAGSILHPVQVVGVVGQDYPYAELERLASRGIDWSGVERAQGESFRWKGKYSYDLQSRETLETRLGVRLLNRTTRRTSLTDEGATYYDACTRILAEIDEADATISAGRIEPQGVLRVAKFLAPSFDLCTAPATCSHMRSGNYLLLA